MGIEMEPVDCLRSTAICLFFLVVGFGKQSTYFKADFLLYAVSAFGNLFFPEVLVEILVSQPVDDVHIYLMRAAGVGLVCLLVASYLLRDAEDDNITASHIMSRFLISSIVVALDCYAYYYSKKPFLAITFLTGPVLAQVFWCICSFIQLIRFGPSNYSYWNQNIDLDTLTRCVMIEAFIFLFAGFTHMAYPDFHCSFISMPGFKLDEFHLFLMRMMGAVYIGIGILSMSAISYADEDKKKLLLSKLIFLALLCVLAVSYYWFYSIVAFNHLCMGLTFFAIHSLICLTGYYAQTKDD